MKYLILVVLVLFLQNVSAQNNCKPYVPATKGTIWEISNYSAKGKLTGTITYEMLDKFVSGNNYTFTIKSVSFDAKGNEIFINEFEAYCKNGKFEFDMAFKMDGGALQAYKDMDLSIDASEFEIPDMNAAVGTPLKDGSLLVTVGSLFKMTFLITDRKIETKEKITTPAGSFNSLVISQRFTTNMIIKLVGSSKEWYAEEIGMIRSESYNKKGKLIGYSELTKLDN